jgi:hypothetical protein
VTVMLTAPARAAQQATHSLPTTRPAGFVPVSRADRLLAAMLGYRLGSDLNAAPSPWDTANERQRSRDRIVAVHSALARRRHRRLGALGGRRLP